MLKLNKCLIYNIYIINILIFCFSSSSLSRVLFNNRKQTVFIFRQKNLINYLKNIYLGKVCILHGYCKSTYTEVAKDN